MAGWAPGKAGRWWVVGCAAFVANLWAQEGAAQPAVAGAQPGRVRPADEKAASLLGAGRARSATFRSLVETLERSDLVVHVETGVLALPGQVQFVTATPKCRYIRVTVRVPGLDDDLLPWLAHELWHAAEIAGAPEVRSRESLQVFYERVGGSLRAGPALILETAGAQRTQAIVERELRVSARVRPKRP